MNRNESDWFGMNFNPKLLPGWGIHTLFQVRETEEMWDRFYFSIKKKKNTKIEGSGSSCPMRPPTYITALAYTWGVLKTPNPMCSPCNFLEVCIGHVYT